MSHSRQTHDSTQERTDSLEEHSPSHEGDFSEAEEASEDAAEENCVPIDSEDDDEGEDLFDNMERDYIANPELDRYDPTMLDEARYAPMTGEERRAAEKEMDARMARGLSSARDASVDLEEDDAGVNDQDETVRAARRRRAQTLRIQSERAMKPDNELVSQALESLPECPRTNTALALKKIWTTPLRDTIAMVFEGFLWTSIPSGEAEGGLTEENISSQQNLGIPQGIRASEISFHLEKIQKLVREELSSLEIHWNHLHTFAPRLCDWLMCIPIEVLGVFDGVATRLTAAMHPRLYGNKRIAVRIWGHPVVESIRHLRTANMNRLVVVEGVCMRRSDVFPRLSVVYYECTRCHCNSNGPYDQRDQSIHKMKKVCEQCQSKGPFVVAREKTIFQNYQKVVVQELTSAVPPGHIPRYKVVVLLGDLVDKVRPGDDVIITGILEARQDYLSNAKTGFPVFSTWIVGNHLQKRRERIIASISDRDTDIINALARNPLIREKIIASIAPSIWGHQHIKTALAMAMFGGVRRDVAGKHVVRGDINVLIIGDPGMGKSQFLKYVEQTFPRTVLTTGKGASAVGLTAAVRRCPMSGEWTLEGGAFVLADQGICLIDEFDKMSERDRVSIHEAMEQQSISISKAGIVTSLRARCSVIAAANPAAGVYNPELSLADNVELSDPILSRFDVIAVVRDQLYAVLDEHLASHVLNSHMSAHPNNTRERDLPPCREDTSVVDIDPHMETENEELPSWVHGNAPIPADMLRKYIIHARQWCFPEIRKGDEQTLPNFYANLRTSQAGGVPMTVRHLESIMRMATANAKMRLSRFVDKSDIDLGISTMLESFIQSQQRSVASFLGRKFARYRTLATSSDEIIENILLMTLTEKSREFMMDDFCGEGKMLDDVEFKPCSISLEELITFATSKYGLTETIVNKFIESQRFQAKYHVIVRRITICKIKFTRASLQQQGTSKLVTAKRITANTA